MPFSLECIVFYWKASACFARALNQDAQPLKSLRVDGAGGSDGCLHVLEMPMTPDAEIFLRMLKP